MSGVLLVRRVPVAGHPSTVNPVFKNNERRRTLVIGPRFFMTRHSILFTLLCAFTVLCSCGGKNGFVGGGQGSSVFLKSITMTPVNPTITLAVSPQPPATKQFIVIGQYNVGNPKDITDQMTWISADSKVATLDTKGVATATGSGKVIITARVSSRPHRKNSRRPLSSALSHSSLLSSLVPRPRRSRRRRRNSSLQPAATTTVPKLTSRLSWPGIRHSPPPPPVRRLERRGGRSAFLPDQPRSRRHSDPSSVRQLRLL